LNLKTKREIIIRLEDNLSHKIKIKKIVPIIEINDPTDEIIFHDKDASG
jgi:hypothetical protein